MLSQTDRDRLNDVVGQMEAAGELPENIQEAVNQFKAKYDVESTQTGLTPIAKQEPEISITPETEQNQSFGGKVLSEGVESIRKLAAPAIPMAAEMVTFPTKTITALGEGAIAAGQSVLMGQTPSKTWNNIKKAFKEGWSGENSLLKEAEFEKAAESLGEKVGGESTTPEQKQKEWFANQFYNALNIMWIGKGLADIGFSVLAKRAANKLKTGETPKPEEFSELEKETSKIIADKETIPKLDIIKNEELKPLTDKEPALSDKDIASLPQEEKFPVETPKDLGQKLSTEEAKTSTSITQEAPRKRIEHATDEEWLNDKTIHLMKEGATRDEALSEAQISLNNLTGRNKLSEMRKVHSANTDNLTGIRNRNWAVNNNKLQEREIKDPASGEITKEPVYPDKSAMVDIDFFKKINDTYGHGTGDRVLRALGDLLNKHITEKGLGDAVRYGGEEFLLIPKAGVSDERLAQAIEDIRNELVQLKFSRGDSVLKDVKISAGIGENLEEADKMLYGAKQAGRNQTFYKGTKYENKIQSNESGVGGILEGAGPKGASFETGARGEPGIGPTETGGQVLSSEAPKPLSAEEKAANDAMYARTLKISKSPRTTEYWEAIKRGASSAMEPISSRLGRLNPKLKSRMRQHVSDVFQQQQKYRSMVVDYLNIKKKMPANDYAILDLAEKRGDINKIKEIVSKYKAEKEYENVRKALDEIYLEAKNAGLDVTYRSNHHPRAVANYKGLVKEITNNPELKGKLEKAIAEKSKAVGRDLTEEEKTVLVNNVLRGIDSPIGLSGPGQLKQRVIEDLTPELNKYYENSDVALLRYIDNVIETIEARRLFGKGADIVDGKMHLSNSIGKYVADLVGEGKLTADQQQEMVNMMSAYFKPGKMNAGLSLYRDLEYMDTMGSPLSAMTQLQDLSWSLADSGVLNTAKALAKKKQVTLEDLGVKQIGEEFSTPSGMAKAVNTVFKYAGITKLDRLGKSTLINSALLRYQNMVKSNGGINALKKEVGFYFKDGGEQLIKDLQNKTISDDVKFALFNKLLDYNPISKLEMPEIYNKSGNSRLLYMLKSYTVKQLSIYRDKVFDEIAKGNTAEGLKNLGKLTAALMATGMTMDAVKDFVSRRKFDLEDTAIDNVFKLAGFSKFIIWQARQKGSIEALTKLVLPPFKIAESIVKDVGAITSGKAKGPQDLELPSVIPEGGRLYSWWFGKGRQATLKKELENEDYRDRVKEINKVVRKYKELEASNPKEAVKFKSKNYNLFNAFASEEPREDAEGPPITLGQFQSDIGELKEKIEISREANKDNEVKYYKKKLEQIYDEFNKKWEIYVEKKK